MPGQSFQAQFIGAQSLYQKIKNEYDQISTGKKDDPMKALRDSIFQMLTNFQADQQRLSVIERLCMAIAMISLKACNTFWVDSVKDII